jgi:hypothetical protein
MLASQALTPDTPILERQESQLCGRLKKQIRLKETVLEHREHCLQQIQCNIGDRITDSFRVLYARPGLGASERSWRRFIRRWLRQAAGSDLSRKARGREH